MVEMVGMGEVLRTLTILTISTISTIVKPRPPQLADLGEVRGGPWSLRGGPWRSVEVRGSVGPHGPPWCSLVGEGQAFDNG